jgi:hypothetical protein
MSATAPSSGSQQQAAGGSGLSARASKLTDRLYRIRSNTDSELHAQHHQQEDVDVAAVFPSSHRFAQLFCVLSRVKAEGNPSGCPLSAVFDQLLDWGSV